MKNTLRHIAAPTVLALAFMTSAAFAQTATPAAPTSPAPAASTAHKHGHGHGHGHKRAQKRGDFIEKRINDLHSQLKITAAQSSQWDAFAQTMRDSAKKAGDSYRERAQKLSTLNADDAMKSYAALTQMHADNTQKLAAAFSTLYATLSDDQKKTADVLFRDESAKRHAARKHRKSTAPQGHITGPTPVPAPAAK
jgi:protein CpxP